MSTLQQQKAEMEQRLKEEIAGLRDEKQQAAASAAAQIQACLLHCGVRDLYLAEVYRCCVCIAMRNASLRVDQPFWCIHCTDCQHAALQELQTDKENLQHLVTGSETSLKQAQGKEENSAAQLKVKAQHSRSSNELSSLHAIGT